MKYINTDDSEKYDIKYVVLTESLLRGSTARFVCNPIVDDVEADPDAKEEYQPPNCLVLGDASINDLASWRWQGCTVDAETERELIRRIQEGNPRCRAGQPRGCSCRSCRARFDPRPGKISLLPAFHHSIRKIAGGYIPKGSSRRKYRASDSLIFQELMAVGCFGLFKAAFEFDFSKDCRLWTIAKPKIKGLIKNEANYLRRYGYSSGDTVARYFRKEVSERSDIRIDRFIFDNLGASPEELLEAQKKLVKRPLFHSLQEAADALKGANNLEDPEVYSAGGDGCDIERGRALTESEDDSFSGATKPVEEWRDLYDSHNPLKWPANGSRHAIYCGRRASPHRPRRYG
jgi:hypothetical protein